MSDDETDNIEAMHVVMNTFEFLSVAMLNEAIDEDIVNWSYEYFFSTAYTNLIGYIQHCRDVTSDGSMYCNFTTMAEKWNPELVKLKKPPNIAVVT